MTNVRPRWAWIYGALVRSAATSGSAWYAEGMAVLSCSGSCMRWLASLLLHTELFDQGAQHLLHGRDALERQKFVRLMRLGDVAGAEDDGFHAHLVVERAFGAKIHYMHTAGAHAFAHSHGYNSCCGHG